jgi:hypothetical protein
MGTSERAMMTMTAIPSTTSLLALYRGVYLRAIVYYAEYSLFMHRGKAVSPASYFLDSLILACN